MHKLITENTFIRRAVAAWATERNKRYKHSHARHCQTQSNTEANGSWATKGREQKKEQGKLHFFLSAYLPRGLPAGMLFVFQEYLYTHHSARCIKPANVYTHRGRNIHTHTHTYTHTHTHTHLYTYLYIFISISIYICIYICIRTSHFRASFLHFFIWSICLFIKARVEGWSKS